MSNPYTALLALLPSPSLQVGTVDSVAGGTAVVSLPDGAKVTARGSTSPGSHVFVRDGLIEGPAPTLSLVEIDV